MQKLVFYAAAWLALCVQMGIYIHYKIRGKGKAYTISKCCGSAIFLATTVAAICMTSMDAYSLMILISMILSAIGDYCLSLDHGHKRIRMGAGAFAGAHLCYIAAFAYIGRLSWRIAAIAAGLYLIEILGSRAIKLNFRGAGKGAAIYMLTVTTMTAFAVTLPFGSGLSARAAIMTAAGAVLFLISDIFWMCYGLDRSAPKPLLKALNVLTYFPAQLLIAGALLWR